MEGALPARTDFLADQVHYCGGLAPQIAIAS